MVCYHGMGQTFEVKDCALITRMGGVESAFSIRELRERITVCPPECLFHHFCETAPRPTFDDPEFRNDFSVWAARFLRDRVLAERLGVLNPYSFPDMESLRRAVLDVLDDRHAEVPYLTTVPRGEEFLFMRAVTVVFSAGLVLKEPKHLTKILPQMSLSSIYFHFIEARRRTPTGLDDFSEWFKEFDASETVDMIASLREIDFYYLSLSQLKERMIHDLSSLKGVAS